VELDNSFKYNFDKKNIPKFRMVIDFLNLKESSYILLNPPKEIIMEIYSTKRKKEKKEIIKSLLDKLSKSEIEKRLMEKFNNSNDKRIISGSRIVDLDKNTFYYEIIAPSKSKVLMISKKRESFIEYDDLVKLLLDLKKGKHYMAIYYDMFSESDKRTTELIDLNDFNFQFKNKENIDRNVRILQIIDSEPYEFREFESTLNGLFFIKRNYEEFKKNRYIRRDKDVYKYLDTEDFEFFDRLPNFYPDKTEKILNDKDFTLIFKKIY